MHLPRYLRPRTVDHLDVAIDVGHRAGHQTVLLRRAARALCEVGYDLHREEHVYDYPDDHWYRQLPREGKQEQDRADDLKQEARRCLKGDQDLLLNGIGDLVETRCHLPGKQVVEEREVLPFDGLMSLPLYGDWQTDADRMRVQNVGDVEKDRIKKAKNAKSQKRFSTKCSTPSVATPSTITDSPQMIVRLMASTAIDVNAIATTTPRNIRMKCRSTAPGPLVGSG